MSDTVEQRASDEADNNLKKLKQLEIHQRRLIFNLKLKLKSLNKKIQTDLNKMAVIFSKSENYQQTLLDTLAIQESIKIAKRLKSSIKIEVSKLNAL